MVEVATPMKFSLLIALGCLALMSACTSTMRVTHTEVATGAAHPKAIYIRPFSVEYAEFRDGNNPNSQAIRKSQAPIQFAEVLQEELSKIAPAWVLKPDEEAPLGWLVEGSFERIDTGIPNTGNNGALVMHVRVIEVDRFNTGGTDGKSDNIARGPNTRYGRVIYAFDVEGHGISTSHFDRISSEIVGSSLARDYRNAAERIMLALSPDPFRYGVRDAPLARN